MITLEPRSCDDGERELEAVHGDAAVTALMLIRDPDAAGLADRADGRAEAFRHREVVWDRGCGTLRQAPWRHLFDHPGIAAVMLDKRRRVVGRLSRDADELEIDEAFRNGEKI